MRPMSRLASWPVLLSAALLALLAAAPVLAAEVAGGNSYRLEAGEVIADDLYVSAEEAIIAGTVEGDLIAAGAYVEVSGRVTGDATIAALGGVLLLALLMQVPYLGWLVAPVSFVLALGGLLLARRTADAWADPGVNR